MAPPYAVSPSVLGTDAICSLAPIRRTTVVRGVAAKVASTAAKTSSTFLVHDWATCLAILSEAWRANGPRRLGHSTALAVAGLAASTAVDVLVLDVVLGTAVAG